MNINEFKSIAISRTKALKSFIPTLGAVSYAFADENGLICSGLHSFCPQSEEAKLFCIGSVSKTFTATAVLMLCERGELSLDEPVVRYLPEFTVRDGGAEDITVCMLLDHSSGLAGGSYVGMNTSVPDEDFCQKTVLQFNASQKLAAAPGEYSVYRNDGFSLAQLIIERVSAMSFTEFLRENIFEPLGLTDAYTAADVPEEKLLRVYGEDGALLPPEYVNALGAGGLYLSAEDTARFGAALISGRLISEASLVEMRRNYSYEHEHPSKEHLTYGFGLGLDMVEPSPMLPDEPMLFKAGGTIYCSASFSVFPSHGLCCTVLSCCPEKGNGLLLKMLSDNLTAELLTMQGKPPAPAIMHSFGEECELPPELCQKSGLYAASFAQLKAEITNNGVLTVTPYKDGVLLPEAAAKYTYRSDGFFAGGDSGLKFIDDFIMEAADVRLPLEGRGTLSGLSCLAARRVSEKCGSFDAWKSRAGLWGAVNIPMENLSGRPDVRPVLSLLALPEDFGGYLLFDDQLLELTDDRTADFRLKLPDMNGSDLSCVHIREDGLLEYGGMVYRHESEFPMLCEGEINFGSAKENLWFTVPEGAVVEISGDCRAVLFDKKRQRLADTLTGKKSLAGGCYLQLTGRKNNTATIKFMS